MPSDYSNYSIENLIKEFNDQTRVLEEWNPFNKAALVVNIRETAEIKRALIKKKLLSKLQILNYELGQADICNLQIITRD